MLAMDNHHHENTVELMGGEKHEEELPTSIEAMKASIAQAAPAPEAEPATNGTAQHVPEAQAASAIATTEAKPVPAETKPAVPADSTKAVALVKKQMEHCSNVLKGLKRHSQSGPFQVPVDPVALGIPDYPTVIKNPMDLSTIQSRMDLGVYEQPEAFREDVKLMFNNCYTYNKPDTQVYVMAKSLERYFDGFMGKMPTELTQAAAAPSQDFGGKRKKSEASPSSRPRRDSAAVSGTNRTTVIPSLPSGRSKRSSPEITFCMATWKEMTKKSNAHIAWPFMEPVDPVKLGIPDYFTVVKNPMDLSTIKKKLDAGAYGSPEEFEADVRLMLQNCYLYNGAESDVAKIGRELEAVFDRKWAGRPVPGAAGASSFDDGFDADADKILQLNKQIQALQKELDELLTKRQQKRAGAPSTKHHAPAPKPKVARTMSSVESSATMTFEEKRQLSQDVNNLSPEKLGKVVEIIHNSMPNLQQQSDSDVIELDIESLDINTLRQLQKYVNECKGGVVKKKAAPRPKKASVAAQTLEAAAPLLEEAVSSDDSSSSDDE